MDILRSHLAIAIGTAFAGVTALVLPQTAAAQKAELHVDAATHTMPGMGGLGALGRFTGNMSGGTAVYGQARHAGMPGRYLDIGLENPHRPGTPAKQAVPKGLGLGASIDLLPPERAEPTPALPPGGIPGLAEDTRYEVRYYWGCGETVGKGQPRTFTTTVRNGKPSMSGSAPQPRAVPKTGLEPDPRHALWPNPSSRRSVSGKASLVGAHSVTGDGLATAIDFQVDRAQDFMPELHVRSSGDGATGITLDWDAVDGATAYFAHALAMEDGVVVMWSSSEDGYAGPELMTYLPAGTVSQWLGKRTLMTPDTRRCSIPRGVFAAHPMVQMIAHGPTRTIETGNARVHLRTKSTAMLMGAGLGGAMSGEAARESAKDGAKESAKDTAKSLLRGLIGR